MTLSKENQRKAVVILLLIWCAALIAFRIHLAYDGLSRWLVGNLLLAIIPLLFSTAFKAATERKRPVLAASAFVLWLLFLPNAPYILTDLIHLANHPRIPLWYSLTVLLSCGGTGALLGYISLLDVHDVIARKYGQAVGWTVAIGSLILCAFGIYLGRFVRLNSWYAVTRPVTLVRSIADAFVHPGLHPRPIPVTLVFGVGLIVGYLAVRTVVISPEPRRGNDSISSNGGIDATPASTS